MVTTIPYSVRIPKDLLEEMRRFYDKMEPPKPTFSAILSHILKLGWQAYSGRSRPDNPLAPLVIPTASRTVSIGRLPERT